MKSEHRHELETNELSAGLAKSIERLKPVAGQILTGVGLLLALYAGLSIWNAQTAQTERDAWEAYALATDSADPEMKSLQLVAADEKYAGTRMSEWAYVGWADRQVLNAMRYYFADREKTKDLLRGVEGIYEQFSKDASDPQVLNRARFGLARVYELQNKLDEAKSQYLTVRGNLQSQASARAEQLGSDSIKDTYDWLATAELPKRDRTGGSGATGQRPEFNAATPAAKPSGDSITEKSLEDLLGELESSTDENRYGEKDEPFTTEGSGTSSEDAGATDVEPGVADESVE
ncbi:MAG: hypothetical protein AAGD11_20690 [Planctomycetota bacterium]